ncbi:hypothetical protein PMHK_36590 [Pseudomonas sp. MHK4]
MHHLELLVTQVQADKVGDMQVILDHEDAFGLFHPLPSFYCNPNHCRSELAREKPEDAAWHQAPRVIVDHHREQARPYSVCVGIVRVFRGPSYHELFNFP